MSRTLVSACPSTRDQAEWDAIEAPDEWQFIAMINGENPGLDGVFFAMVNAHRTDDHRMAVRLARAYHDWLAHFGRAPEGYSVAEAMAEVKSILGSNPNRCYGESP